MTKVYDKILLFQLFYRIQTNIIRSISGNVPVNGGKKQLFFPIPKRNPRLDVAMFSSIQHSKDSKESAYSQIFINILTTKIYKLHTCYF
ncbi:MAG: hypothetical protein BHV82_09515 [Odoribacter sp. 43_10]|nr:MAG: hypothetical protein BHV82_09515 [Odoribacter sp. 43_10]